MNLPVNDPQPPTICALLRTKTAFGPYGSANDLTHADSTTAVFWCLGTMSSAGPDDELAHAQLCREGRRCFQPPVE